MKENKRDKVLRKSRIRMFNNKVAELKLEKAIKDNEQELSKIKEKARQKGWL